MQRRVHVSVKLQFQGKRPPTLTEVKRQETSTTSPIDGSSVALPGHEQQHQSNGTAINGTVSQFDKLLSKLIPTPSTAPNPSTNNATLETVFASASACAPPSPTPNAVAPPPTTTSKGLALLDTIVASAAPSPGTIPASTIAHRVSTESFPPPRSALIHAPGLYHSASAW